MTSSSFAGRVLSVVTAFACLTAPVAASAASERFALEYRVERTASAKLSIAECLDVAKRESAAVGYIPAVENRYPGQLTTFASGPRQGGASLIVYCIAVDQKTAFVVQAIDYNRPSSPQSERIANRVHEALLAAARR